MTECDVLVVGAGCSGSVVALKLAKEGFNVIVVEKEDRIGSHTKPKFDFSEDTGLNEIFEELGLPFSEKTFGTSRWFSRDYFFELKSRVNDLYFKRGPLEDCFEVKVMNDAVDKGVVVLLNSNVSKIKFEGNLVGTTVKIKVKGKSKEVKPKVIVGADGFNSRIADMTSLHVTRNTAEIAACGITGGDFNMPAAETEVFFDTEYAPGGYFYIGKTREGEGVAAVVVENTLISEPIENYYKKFTTKNDRLKKILNGCRVNNDFQGKTRSGLMKRRARGNVILVGDAARTLDPLMGYGMRNAIISSYEASRTIESYLKKEVNTLSSYEQKLESIIHDTRKDAKLRRALNRLDNRDFNTIVKILRDLQKEGVNIDTLGDKNHAKILKHILKNATSSINLGLKVLLAFVH